jgi:hypothetical protein
MPILIKDLPSHPNIHPSKLIKLLKRPKTKRIRKGALNHQPKKCENYKQTGHNIKRYTGLSVAKNKREERARD